MGETGNFQLLVEKIVSTGISGGNPYRFKVRAHNIHGWSTQYSSEATIYATSAPSQPAVMATVPANADIELQWQAPFNNYESISAY
jgi:hypothetical protein